MISKDLKKKKKNYKKKKGVPFFFSISCHVHNGSRKLMTCKENWTLPWTWAKFAQSNDWLRGTKKKAQLKVVFQGWGSGKKTLFFNFFFF